MKPGAGFRAEIFRPVYALLEPLCVAYRALRDGGARYRGSGSTELMRLQGLHL